MANPMNLQLRLEFPLHILERYHGASNLDCTVDDEIWGSITTTLTELQVPHALKNVEMYTDGIPGSIDPFLALVVKIESQNHEELAVAIRSGLEGIGRSNGLCVKKGHLDDSIVLDFDGEVADIELRRQYRELKKRKR